MTLSYLISDANCLTEFKLILWGKWRFIDQWIENILLGLIWRLNVCWNCRYRLKFNYMLWLKNRFAFSTWEFRILASCASFLWFIWFFSKHILCFVSKRRGKREGISSNNPFQVWIAVISKRWKAKMAIFSFSSWFLKY